MHLGDGTVTAGCAALGLAAAGAGAALGWRFARNTQRPRPLPFALATAGVFVAQAFNLTVIPGHATGHVIGAILLAAWFGPLWGLAAMALVLGLQSVLFADGGLLSFGLNLLAMGVVPCLVVYPLWQRVAGRLHGPARWATLGAAAWLSTMAGAGVCTLALLTRPAAAAHAAALAGTMFSVHARIGLIEAAATLLAIGAVGWARSWSAVRVALVATPALAAAALAAPLASSPFPDGLEYSLATHGVAELSGPLAEQLASVQSLLAVLANDAAGWSVLAGAAAVAVAAVVLLRVARRAGPLGSRA